MLLCRKPQRQGFLRRGSYVNVPVSSKERVTSNPGFFFPGSLEEFGILVMQILSHILISSAIILGIFKFKPMFKQHVNLMI